MRVAGAQEVCPGEFERGIARGPPARRTAGIERGCRHVSAFGGYNGQAYSPAGEKGRFVLPPEFRKAVKESSGGTRTLCLAAHGKFDCLIGFGLSRREQLNQQLDREEERAIRLGDASFDRDVRAGQLFGFMQVPFDDSGRFVMPDHLRGLGKVEDGLYFHAAGDFFFVWAPEELKRMGPEWKGAQAACATLIAAARKAA
jgi:MraZ protein